jgi:hypothetical protein
MWSTVVDLILSDGPYIALAGLGTLLLIRHHSVAAGCIALGFGLVAAGHIAITFATIETTTVVDADGKSVIAISSVGGLLYWLIEHADRFGIWIAAMGLFGHLLGRPQGGVT